MTEQRNTTMRASETGATRDSDATKHDYEGFLSPLVIDAIGVYMTFHRTLPDKTTRASDNWQAGMPYSWYIKSGWRHFNDWWREHRGLASHEGIVWALLGLWFNVQGYLHEYLKAHPDALDAALARNTKARQERWDEAARAALPDSKTVQDRWEAARGRNPKARWDEDSQRWVKAEEPPPAYPRDAIDAG